MFKNDAGSLPYMVFYVDPNPVPDGVVSGSSPSLLKGLAVIQAEVEVPNHADMSRAVKSVNGRNVVRKHISSVGVSEAGLTLRQM